MNPRVSVIIATCFQPHSLRLLLAAYRKQTWKDFELIVADDGSGEESGRIIEEAKVAGDFPIERVWQPNKGFRKPRILNHAIFHSRGEILLFSDGDCIPELDFVRKHARLCPKDGFAVGGWVDLEKEQSHP